MQSQEFTKLYKKLNSAQKKAVDTIEGAVMVVAGPGTGKTQVLTLRIANILLKTQVNPENILALTFTEAAAYEMRKRLVNIIGHDAYRVEITTFHSFCNNFIKRNQEEFSDIISSESITEIEQLQIVEEIIKSNSFEFIKPLGNLTHYVKPALNAINKLKMENILPTDFEKGLKDMEKEILKSDDLLNTKGKYKGEMKSSYKKMLKEIEKNKELVKVYESYEKKMRVKKFYDYNDMLLEVIKQLEMNQYLLQFLQEKFQYILVDEHQDTNAAQNKIVEMISSFFENPNLFVVGDEKQAIFRFQGASLENFLYFKNKYKKANLINLSENYRSTQIILDATHTLITNNMVVTQFLSGSGSLKKKSEHKEEKIKKIELNSFNSEFYWIAQKLKELLKSTNPNDIAVLVRNNKDIDPLLPILDIEKIPYVVESDFNVLEDIDISKIILILRSIVNPTDEYIAKAMLMDCFNINPLDVYKILNLRNSEKVNVWDILTNDEMLSDLKLNDEKGVKEFVKLYSGKENPKDDSKEISEVGFIKFANNNRLDVVFVEVLNKTGLLKSILKKPHSQETLERLSRIYDEIKELISRNGAYSLSDFIKYIDLLLENNLSLKKNTHVIPTGVIRLMTVHKAKGQEFDYVFVPQAFNSHWGNKIKRGANFNIPWNYLGKKIVDIEINENDDERRLFYVALTRARKNVFISFSNSSEDGREQIASQFITEIAPDHIEDLDPASFEKSLQNFLVLKFQKIEKNPELNFTKEFVSELFKRQGLSVSALNNYLDCPWRFFFVSLIRIPKKINDAELFGNAIHEGLNRYIISLKRGRASKEFLIKTFKESKYMNSITTSEVERFIKRGETALGGLYEEKLKYLKDVVESELEIRGIKINDNLFLNGKIDMVEPIDKNFRVNVYDFKTGRVRSRNEIEGKTFNSDGNYKRQLVFYKLLLDRFRNGFFKMKTGIIEFVEPNERGQYKREVFDISNQEADDLLKQVSKVADEIINLSFWNERCGKKECEYCALREFMF